MLDYEINKMGLLYYLQELCLNKIMILFCLKGTCYYIDGF